jgi:predicted solute-binding protein
LQETQLPSLKGADECFIFYIRFEGKLKERNGFHESFPDFEIFNETY